MARGSSRLRRTGELGQADLESIGAVVVAFDPARGRDGYSYRLHRRRYHAIGTGYLRTGLAFLGLLGFALSRITVPVTNRALDPIEATSPYRPHPGRQNLASGLALLAIAGDISGLSMEARGYLALAAGAAFLDKAGEAFIGRQFFRAEIQCLFGAATLAGVGLLVVGATRLGAPLTESSGWHIALLGGLGLSILAVLSIAGLFHTRHTFPFPWTAKLAFVLLIAATALRVLPDFGISQPVGHTH